MQNWRKGIHDCHLARKMGEEMWLKRLERGEEDRNPPSVTWVGKQGGVMKFEQGSS